MLYNRVLKYVADQYLKNKFPLSLAFKFAYLNSIKKSNLWETLPYVYSIKYVV